MGRDDDSGDHEAAVAALRAAIARHQRDPLASVLRQRGLGPYRGYAEMLEALAHAAAAGARLSRIGRTPRGEPIFAVGLGADRGGGATRTSVVVSGLHPLEWIGIEVSLRLLARLAGVDLGGRGVAFLPVANPDGVISVEANLRGRRRRFVRHNAHGVDLNRNFDASWGQSGLVGRLLRVVFAPGARAASEPEVEAIAPFTCRTDVSTARCRCTASAASCSRRTRRGTARPTTRANTPPGPRGSPRLRTRDPIASCSARAGAGSARGASSSIGSTIRHGAISLLVECSRGGAGLRPSRLLEPFAWFNPPRLEAEADAIAGAVAPFVKGLDE